jgi:hypothetical protein
MGYWLGRNSVMTVAPSYGEPLPATTHFINAAALRRSNPVVTAFSPVNLLQSDPFPRHPDPGRSDAHDCCDRAGRRGFA